MQYHHIHSDSYDYPVWSGTNTLIGLAAITKRKILELFADIPFIGLVCTGTSGLLIAYEIARDDSRFKIRYLKKDNEESHSTQPFLSDSTEPLIVVDDIVSSGATMRRIAKKLNEFSHDQKGAEKVVGLCLAYSDVDLIEPVTKLFPNLKHVIH